MKTFAPLYQMSRYEEIKMSKNNVIVIGYGNHLRSDEGIGQRVANEIASWGLSTVKVLAVHQLTSDLTATLASVDLVIFVDAYLSSEAFDVCVQSVLPSSDKTIAKYTNEPQSLLALTQALYGHCPTAWSVKVPGINFETGDRISRIAESGKAIALVKIIQILGKVKTLWVNFNN